MSNSGASLSALDNAAAGRQVRELDCQDLLRRYLPDFVLGTESISCRERRQLLSAQAA